MSARRPFEPALREDRRAAYAGLRAALSGLRPAGRREAMIAFVDAAWRALAPTGVSWIGFYVDAPEAPDPERLVLAAREPKPACSPIGLHGACGRALTSAKPFVVRDVADLGANYIACDPRDRSEVVIPCLDERGRPWGVLDLDSHSVGAFDDHDAVELEASLRVVGLSR